MKSLLVLIQYLWIFNFQMNIYLYIFTIFISGNIKVPIVFFEGKRELT